MHLQVIKQHSGDFSLIDLVGKAQLFEGALKE